MVERGGVSRDRVRLVEVGRNGVGGGWVTGSFPVAARHFSPRVNFQCRLSYVVLTAPVCNRMHRNLHAR